MFDGANGTLIFDVDQDKQMFSSHERSLIYVSSPSKSRYKKEMKQR